MKSLLLIACLLPGAVAAADNGSAGEYWVYFGTYTVKTSEGIYA